MSKASKFIALSLLGFGGGIIGLAAYDAWRQRQREEEQPLDGQTAQTHSSTHTSHYHRGGGIIFLPGLWGGGARYSPPAPPMQGRTSGFASGGTSPSRSGFGGGSVSRGGFGGSSVGSSSS